MEVPSGMVFPMQSALIGTSRNNREAESGALCGFEQNLHLENRYTLSQSTENLWSVVERLTNWRLTVIPGGGRGAHTVEGHCMAIPSRETDSQKG
jgi:hypothetical protein